MIPRQQNPSFSISRVRQHRIVRVVAIRGVEPDEAQVPRQSTQVNIGHESNGLQRPWSNAGQHPDVNGKESREDGDSVAGPHDVVEVDGPPIDEDQVNLWMWNSETLDEILYRRRGVDEAPPRDLSTMRRQEVVERAVDSDSDVDHVVGRAIGRSVSSSSVSITARHRCSMTRRFTVIAGVTSPPGIVNSRGRNANA